jgi:hypothetical protein
MHDPIAYTYEADTHCPACAIARFGTEPGRAWVRDDATDSEGNPVGAIAPWDEWCNPQEAGRAVLWCGTCRGPIAEHWHGRECAECGFAIGWDGGHTTGPVCGPCASDVPRCMVRAAR